MSEVKKLVLFLPLFLIFFFWLSRFIIAVPTTSNKAIAEDEPQEKIRLLTFNCLATPFTNRKIRLAQVAKEIANLKPDVVINCIGMIKQLQNANNPLVVLPINSIFPHRLSLLCRLAGARLIHISTDCVFSGEKGGYTEKDISDANDLYGKSKYIGEIHDEFNTVTIRTSIIGHELNSKYALIDWFLSQDGTIRGYTKCIFSGLPTVELASVIKNIIIPNKELSGLYHVSSTPISKFDLLSIVAKRYGKNINILEDSEVVLDRSLDSSCFKQATGYEPPDWEVLIDAMYNYKNHLRV